MLISINTSNRDAYKRHVLERYYSRGLLATSFISGLWLAWAFPSNMWGFIRKPHGAKHSKREAMIVVDRLDREGDLLATFSCQHLCSQSTLATEVQWTSGFIIIKKGLGLHLTVVRRAKDGTQQATKKRSTKSICHVLQKCFLGRFDRKPFYTFNSRKLYSFSDACIIR